MLDIIPEGTFHADKNYTAEQFRAIEMVKTIGDRLANDNPEIADFYRAGMTQLAIAQKVVPDAEKYPVVAEKAVGNALRQLISPDEMSQILHSRHQESADRNFDHSSLIQSQKALIRHQIHGVNVGAMLEGRGRIAWTAEEKQLALDLTKDPNFIKPNYSPDYDKIAKTLNGQFHNGKDVRYANSVLSWISYKKKIEKLNRQK